MLNRNDPSLSNDDTIPAPETFAPRRYNAHAIAPFFLYLYEISYKLAHLPHIAYSVRVYHFFSHWRQERSSIRRSCNTDHFAKNLFGLPVPCART